MRCFVKNKLNLDPLLVTSKYYIIWVLLFSSSSSAMKSSSNEWPVSIQKWNVKLMNFAVDIKPNDSLSSMQWIRNENVNRISKIRPIVLPQVVAKMFTSYLCNSFIICRSIFFNNVLNSFGLGSISYLCIFVYMWNQDKLSFYIFFFLVGFILHVYI